MIRVLVVDDDYHVARAHALSVAAGARASRSSGRRTPGPRPGGSSRPSPTCCCSTCTCRTSAGSTSSGSSPASGARVPDFLLVTAARDIDAVRTAMQLGAFYYLVKPFSFAALRRAARGLPGVGRADRPRRAEADQHVVDTLYSLRGHPAARGRDPYAPADDGPRPRDRPAAPAPVGAAEVAEILGASRPTAQRYLAPSSRSSSSTSTSPTARRDDPSTGTCPAAAESRPSPQARVPPSGGRGRATRTWGRQHQRNAEMPVISRPTISDCIGRCPRRCRRLDVGVVAGDMVLEQDAVAADDVARLGARPRAPCARCASWRATPWAAVILPWLCSSASRKQKLHRGDLGQHPGQLLWTSWKLGDRLAELLALLA